MDRVRFEELLAAYGADVRRWPDAVRAEAQAFAASHANDVAAALRDAESVDRALGLAIESGEAAPELLVRRILKQAPKPQMRGFDRGALAALAACAVFGILIGYGGGLFAPAADADDSYFTAAFSAPFEGASGDEG